MMRSDWSQGQHVALIGKTQSGKTYLLRRLATLRTHTLMLVTKGDTVNWDTFGWRTVKQARLIDPTKGHKWRLFPDWSKAGMEFIQALQMCWADGNWCICFDEMYHLKEVGLEDLSIKFLTQGASKHISVVGGSQRPAWVTKFLYSETSHVFCFKLDLGQDRKRIRDELGREYEEAVAELKRFEFAYLNQASRVITIGREDELYAILNVKEGSTVGAQS